MNNIAEIILRFKKEFKIVRMKKWKNPFWYLCLLWKLLSEFREILKCFKIPRKKF